MNVEKVTDYIVNWLKEYAKTAKVNGFVIGVSGGIDSAVTSILCAKTGLPTLCVEMPIHQVESQVTRAETHIQKLQNEFKNVSKIRTDLTETFETFKKIIPLDIDEAKVNLSLANTRARLRMTTLYYLAGINGYLVAGTGNKVEDFGVGFYTKYGDGGVDLSPIADLMKSEVYVIAKHLGVINTIQNAQPTDGLFGDSRTDEDQLGASYDELEKAMKQQESGIKIDQLKGREKVVFSIYTRLNKTNQHKMLPIPVCEIPYKIKNQVN